MTRATTFCLSLLLSLSAFAAEYVVTSTSDSGPGSLRQAILDVNRDCTDSNTPCRIEFAVDPAETLTLRPESALPAVTGAVHIDGGSRVVLDGSAAGGAHGLLLNGSVGVTGLTIRNFSGNGIEANGGRAVIRLNQLVENGARGVQVNGGEALVADNVLSRNRRAGGFFWTSGEVRAERNVIVGNGASGLFFHKPAVSRIASHAKDNFIAFNAHAGIGLSLAADGEFAENTFQGNVNAPIDVGLDGDTRETRDGLPGQGGLVGAPILTSARFDGTGTIVTGRLARRGAGFLVRQRVILYATAGPGAKTEVVAVVNPEEGSLFRDDMFSVRIERDLRGHSLQAASWAIYVYNLDDFARGTSELSVPLPVE